MEIRYSSRAERQFEKLAKNKALVTRLFTAIEEIENNPQVGKPLEGEHEGFRSLRSGDWRIIYEIDLK